jgi:uncharacterized tellurite resistance protein B-like protein
MNNMTPTENLYYAIGQLAFSIASADGEVQKAERQKFCDLVAQELNDQHYGFNIASIIFQVMDKERCSTKDSYDRAMKQMKLNSHYLSPELKASFIHVMEKIAEAYPPVTLEEALLIDKFKADIEPLKGDPACYSQIKPIQP